MTELDRVLVFDPNETGREGLAAVLGSHCGEVICASEASDARRVIDAHPDLSLVIAAIELPATGGLHLLGELARRERRPRVVVVTSRPLRDEELAVADLGADGYLAKPILFRDIARVLKAAAGTAAKAAQRIRSRAVGVAVLEDAASGSDSRRESSSQMAWDIHDLSITGAFLETKGPLASGREHLLALVLGGLTLRVRAKVVRLQQPCWEHVAGAGVEFTAFEDPQERELLAAYIDEQQ